MKRKVFVLFLSLIMVFSIFAQKAPVISERQDLAIFKLGFYGYNIPINVIGTVDGKIQKLFTEMRRFNVIAMEQRFNAVEVSAFIDIIKKSKEKNFVVPEKVQFGEAFLTEADFQKIIGSFIVAVPVITSYDSSYNTKNKSYEVRMNTQVTFINVATGSTLGVAEIETSGSSKELEIKAITQALDGIPSGIEYETRKIPEFQIQSRVISSENGAIKMEKGQDMGIQVGDEYAIIEVTEVEGLTDSRETGLVVVKNVGSQVTTATILYSEGQVAKNTQMREIPRSGVEAGAYVHYMKYLQKGDTSNGALVFGFKLPVVRYFYDLRPVVGIEIMADMNKLLPVNVYVGAEYVMYLGRLQLYGDLVGGTASNVILRYLEGTYSETDDEIFTHIGGKALVGGSLLIGRDMKLYAEAGVSAWISMVESILPSYYGIVFGGGASFKL